MSDQSIDQANYFIGQLTGLVVVKSMSPFLHHTKMQFLLVKQYQQKAVHDQMGHPVHKQSSSYSFVLHSAPSFRIPGSVVKRHFIPLIALAGRVKLLHALARRAVKLLHRPACNLRLLRGLKLV